MHGNGWPADRRLATDAEWSILDYRCAMLKCQASIPFIQAYLQTLIILEGGGLWRVKDIC